MILRLLFLMAWFLAGFSFQAVAAEDDRLVYQAEASLPLVPLEENPADLSPPLAQPLPSATVPTSRNQKNPEETEMALKRAIAMSPGNAIAYKNLGVFYAQTHRIEESLEVLGIAYELDPNEDEVIDALASSYFLAHQNDELVELYEKALKDKPDDLMRMIHLGEAYVHQGKKKKAAEIFEKVLQRQPNFEPVRFQLIQLYTEKGDMKKVNQHASQLNQKSSPPEQS